jgi:hypothetical protein
MVSVYNGDINHNFQIFNPITINKDSHRFRILHDNSELLLQAPKSCITSIIQPFENIYKITIAFNNYESSISCREFIQKILKIEELISNSQKHYWKTLKKNTRNKLWSNSVKFNNSKTIAYLHVTVDKSVISVFDHNKNMRDIDYITKNSDCISIIYMKHIWRNKNKMGLGWYLYQVKVFRPICKLTECIIYDEYEDSPLKHYFNCNNKNKDTEEDKDTKEDTIIQSKKEDHPIFGKYIKLKRYGASNEAINMKLQQDDIDIADYNRFLNNKSNTFESNNRYAKPNVFSANMFKNARLKKTKPIKNKPAIKKDQKQCVVTKDTLAEAISKLRRQSNKLLNE